MNTGRIVGIALLVGGVILLVMGLNASDSFASEVSEAFTGSPTDRSVWMMVLGAVATAAGGLLTVAGGRSR